MLIWRFIAVFQSKLKGHYDMNNIIVPIQFISKQLFNIFLVFLNK